MIFTTILECKNSSCYLSNKQKRKIDKKYLYNFDIFQKISNKFINIEFIESLLKKPEIEGDEILKTCYSKVISQKSLKHVRSTRRKQNGCRQRLSNGNRIF